MNLKLGIVAREFPPSKGGMEKHAQELVQALSAFCDVVVYTNAHHAGHRYDLGVPVMPVLQRNIWADLSHIRQAEVDALLTLNSGYAPLSYLQDKPVFAYCHGNDYLSPWILSLLSHEHFMVSMLGRTPCLRRYGPPIQREILRRRVERGLRHARHIFVNSRYTRERLAVEYPRLHRPMSVAPPGLPDGFFGSGRGSGAGKGRDGPRRFLTVARLASVARKKNVDGVLRALALLRDEMPFEYRIIGDGDLRASLEGLAAQLGLGDRVTFLGEQDSGGVIRWLDQSDLFILPSRASQWDVESFGIVYVEAAARGVPSLMSRAGGATDAVADGISGIVIDDSEPPAIADGIRRFAAGRDRFTAERIISFAARFHWDNVSTAMWSTIIQGLNGGRHAGAPTADLHPSHATRPPAPVDLEGGRR